MLWICLALLAFAAIAAFGLGDGAAIAGLSGEAMAAVATALALLIYIVGAAFSADRGRLSRASRDLFVWLGVILALVVGYNFREEAGQFVNRVAGEVAPPGHAVNVGRELHGRQAVRIRRQPGGQFIARGKVNGASVALLVDTGATSVMLTSSDAQAAGIKMSKLSFTTPIHTANGNTFAAAVRVDSIEVGAIMIRNVDALVAKPGTLRTSLLGMSFLRRLRSFEFSPDFITLRS